MMDTAKMTKIKKLISFASGKIFNVRKKDEVGMEDYFVILRLFHIRFNDNAETIKSTHTTDFVGSFLMLYTMKVKFKQSLILYCLHIERT